jgi:hypothetical protein
MVLEELVEQVKCELNQTKQYDMRTFGFIYFDHQKLKSQETVEFFVYEKPSRLHRKYVGLTYDLATGECLYRLETLCKKEPTKLSKRMVGFERQGLVTMFSA